MPENPDVYSSTTTATERTASSIIFIGITPTGIRRRRAAKLEVERIPK
jgi:hypothetical protein